MKRAITLLLGMAVAWPALSAGTKKACDTLVTAGLVVTMDASYATFQNGAVAILGGKIVDVGPAADLAGRWAPKKTIARPDAILAPGLVNTHTHAAMNLMRGISDDLPLMEWLTKSIFPAEARNVSPDFVKAGTTLACLEMARGGTTTFVDMYYYESDVAAATEACGLRGVLGETWIDFPVPGHKDLAETEKVTRDFLLKWKGHRRITAAIAPHAPYTCSEATLRAAMAMSKEHGAPLLIHLSETRDEQKTLREKTGGSPTQWLESLGFLGPNVVAAHGVWLDEADIKTLKARNVLVAHNPESNMKLASGTAPVVAMRKAGLDVGLGTDGVAGSNNDLSMFETMDFAGKLAKVTTLDPTALPARDLFSMATREAARGLKMDDRIGSLEAGKEADLIAVELSDARTQPSYDPYSTLVYAAKESDVSLTLVEGRVVFDARAKDPFPTIDQKKAVADAGLWRKKILASLGAK